MLIDIHSHFYPSSYLEHLRERSFPPNLVNREGADRLVMYPEQANSPKPRGAKISPDYYSIEAKLENMDQNGIDGVILSLGNPWLDYLPAQEGAAWAQRLNDEMVEACSRAPQRLWTMACVPAGDTAASAAEARRAAKLPSVVGILTSTRMGGLWMDGPETDPFWAAAEETQLPVFLHPFYGLGGPELASVSDMLRFGLEFPFESTAVAGRLILSGVLDRFPNLKIVLAHAGGGLPTLAGRLEAYCGKAFQDRMKAPVHEYIRRLYYDAITYSPEVLDMVAALAGVDHLLFGTDHPYAAAAPAALRETIRQARLTEAEQQKIFYQNAVELYHI